MRPTHSGWLRTVVLVSALFGVAAVLVNGLQSRLIWDDVVLIGAGAESVAEFGLVEVLTRDFFGRGAEASDVHYYRPLVSASYWLRHAAFGSDPLRSALTNLALHLVVCVLLYALLLQAGVAPGWAGAGVVVFGVMPRLTESVFWISGRTDVMASVFVLAALLVYFGGRPRGRDEPGPAPSRLLAAGGLLFLGLMCKEVAASGFLALTCVEVARPFARSTGATHAVFSTLARRLAPLWSFFALYLAIRVSVVHGLWQTSLSLGPGERLALAAESLGQYALMVADPLHPALRIGSVFAPREPGYVVLGACVLVAGLALLVVCTRGVLRGRSGAERALASVVVAGASLGLVIHLFPFGSDSIAADRFLYLPWAVLVLFVAPFTARLAGGRERVVIGLGAVAMLLFVSVCLQRAAQWDDEVLLWHHTVVHADPHDAVPHSWLGMALLERRAPEAALAHFRHALSIEADKPADLRKQRLILELLANTSVALSELGRDIEALHAIEQSLRYAPEHAPYVIQRAEVLGRLLRFDAARTALEAARRPGADHAALSSALARVVAAERAWATLPSPVADEPASVVATRARVFQELGARRKAEGAWADALARGGDDPGLTLEAAEFHAFRGRAEVALVLLDQLPAGLHARERARATHLRAAALLRLQRAVPDFVVADAAALGGAMSATPRPGLHADAG